MFNINTEILDQLRYIIICNDFNIAIKKKLMKSFILQHIFTIFHKKVCHFLSFQHFYFPF